MICCKTSVVRIEKKLSVEQGWKAGDRLQNYGKNPGKSGEKRLDYGPVLKKK